MRKIKLFSIAIIALIGMSNSSLAEVTLIEPDDFVGLSFCPVVFSVIIMLSWFVCDCRTPYYTQLGSFFQKGFVDFDEIDYNIVDQWLKSDQIQRIFV